MNAQRIAAVIPVKCFGHAKQRLQPVLEFSERHQLARLMFEDVLNVMMQCKRLEAVYVVTSDPAAAELARSAGARTLSDPNAGGLSGAIARAAQTLKRQGIDGMMVVPADVPNIDIETVERLLDAHALPRAVTLVPAGRDGGTNALLCSPPDVIPNCFGHNSFRAHCQLALSCGIEPKILSLPGLHYDIDRPLDLLSFLNHPNATKTYTYLTHSTIGARLLETASFPPAETISTMKMPESATAQALKG